MPAPKHPTVQKIAFIGDYQPRQCGIATFTTDLCNAVAAEYPQAACMAIPVNDREEGYDYPEPVRFEIGERELESYRRAADFLNINNVEVVCVQHEFGIYGGKAGSHLLVLLRQLRMPIVTTLHTVLREPNEDQRRVMDQLAQLSERLVVMTQKGREFLRQIYKVPAKKIEVIPHGIPDTPFVDPAFYKDQFGLDGRTLLLTFGLLSPNKGIEHVIDSLPAILAKHPDVVYVVLGATHPNLLKNEGESYRLSLQRRAVERGVEKNVIFYNRFVSIAELMEFLAAADIYITPYLNEAQITSGTLAYAFGAGKAVISTPYWHAQELLAEGRGLLVPFGDAGKIGEAVIDCLDHEPKRNTMRRNAYRLGREMLWPRVAQRYMETFQAARAAPRLPARRAFGVATLESEPYPLPPTKLDHLLRMSDSTGIIQHAVFNVPRFGEGYCLDDNARAFMLTVLLEETPEHAQVNRAAAHYLAFVWEAFNRETRRFRNFMGFDRSWLETVGSEDSHARALWALGTALGRSADEGFRGVAGELFELGLPIVETFRSPRAWAFTILAIHEYLRRFSGDRAANILREELGERLLHEFAEASGDEWPWFEISLSYDNAKIPHALILSGHWMGRSDFLERGLESLRWLAKLQTSATGCFSSIGNLGFANKSGERAFFDQQPLEAHAMLSACLEAWRITGDGSWLQEARRAFEWFLGRNDLGLPLYDSSTGGCRDGLQWDRANPNQGAESCLAFHLSLIEMQLARDAVSTFQKIKV